MERPMSKEVQDWMEMEKRIHEKEMAMLDKLLEEKRRAEAEAKSLVIRNKYHFVGPRAEDSAKYYDTVLSHGYKGDLDILAWDSAHKFGTRMIAQNLASFRDGITIGVRALEAAEFLDAEHRKAYDSCEEFGRSKKMRELMAVLYSETKRLYGVEVKLL